MPYGDGTGPLGFGPRTGRRAGFCGGYSVPGYLNDTVPRRGFGFRGRGRLYYDPYVRTPYGVPPASNSVNLTAEEQKRVLEEELKELELEKEALEKRLKVLQ
jgi:hypothetical protein